MLAGISGLLFLGPFNRGLFFTWELLYAKVAIFVLLIIWGIFRILKKDGRFIETPLDYALIILFLAYLVSLTVAVNQRAALEQTLKVLAYIVVYLVALDICRYWYKSTGSDKKSAELGDADSSIPPGLNLLLHLLLAAAVVVLVATLGTAAGTFNVQYAYEGNRLDSPMGYINTSAAYYMAAYLLALALSLLASQKFKLYYLVTASLFLFALVLTFSRGAWLMLPPVLLLMLLICAKEDRLRTLLYLLVTAVAALPLSMPADRFFRSGQTVGAWLAIIAVVIAAILLGLGAEWFMRQHRRKRLIFAVISAAAVLAALFMIAVYPALGPLQLERTPEEEAAVQRLEHVVERVTGGQEYELSFELEAWVDGEAELSDEAYVWGIRVISGQQDFSSRELYSFTGMATDGWELNKASFTVPEDSRRLIVQLFNSHPGTGFTARSVKLTGGGKDKALNFYLDRVLPERVYNRLFSDSRDINAGRRLELYGDAFKVIRDHPWLGTGGRGWAALYYGYQDQLYHSNNVHNHFLEVWIEAGIFGFLSFAGIWVILAIAFIRNWRSVHYNLTRHRFWVAIFIPVAALGAHSTIDWNFSLASVGIFLFVLLGASRSLDRVSWPEKLRIGTVDSGTASLAVGISGIVIGLALFSFTLVLLLGFNATWRAHEHLERMNIRQASVELERAISFDPFMAENYHKMGVLLEEQGRRTNNPAAIREAIDMAAKAHRLEPYNPTYSSRYGTVLFNYVDMEEGLEHIDRLMEVRPFSESSYQQAIGARFRMVEHHIEENNWPGAEKHLRDILELEQVIVDRFGSAEPFSYELGRAAFFLQDFTKAEYFLSQVPGDHPMYDEVEYMLMRMKE